MPLKADFPDRIQLKKALLPSMVPPHPLLCKRKSLRKFVSLQFSDHPLDVLFTCTGH